MSEQLKELQKISKILTLAHAEALEKELSKYATTDDRKKVWVLIDGINMPKNMVRLIGKIRVRAINIFLSDLEKAGFVENPKRKPPRKVIDYVPPAWIQLLEEGKGEKSK